MGIYKGMDVDDSLVGLIRRMEQVEGYREELQTLQTVWDNLALLGHLSGTGMDMTETRHAFQRLSGNLLNQLGRQILKKTVLAMHSKAQVAIDILIRNLFERTADIGFLAMDDNIRNYMLALTHSGAEETEKIVSRFREYIRKYSVYFNIILLDTEGRVCAQLDGDNPVSISSDPLIRESLTTAQGYVETFRPTDLLPGQGESLIYSYRVSDTGIQHPLGVLCLCFRFEDEAEKIFGNISAHHDWSIVTLLDQAGIVIASSDPHQIPKGACLQLVLDADWSIVRFAGKEYLATTRASQGYQGYSGPGWYGHVMLPLEHAFEQIAEPGTEDIPDGALQAVMSNPVLFSESLREIPDQAAKIQCGLNRSVWNGNVNQHGDRKGFNPSFSKVLLWEISSTGSKTQDVFERSIDNLHQTVVSSILQDSRFQATLAIDIMDRNLYERANDCRWWAQSDVFRRTLKNAGNSEMLHSTSETLAHINSLYTVYDNLVLFDQQGRILAVSNPHYREYCGQICNDDWVRQTLQLSDSQSYAVSPFLPAPLYRNHHTYIYAAAVLDDTSGQSVLGGIGIVFDAEPQFSAMLSDALPRDEKGEILSGCFGIFADRCKRVIASAQTELPPGASVDLDDAYFKLAPGSGFSGIALLNGRYYAVGAQMSKGYREYKDANDAYRNDVVALVFVPLGQQTPERRNAPSRRGNPESGIDKGSVKNGVEIATFYVDSHWLGLPSSHVIEAIDATGITSVPGSSDSTQGYLMYRDNVIPVVSLWGMLGKADRRRTSHNPQIVVVRLDGAAAPYLGIMVDELGEIPEIPPERIEKISSMLAGGNILAESLIKPENGKAQSEMIVVLAPERIRRRFLAQ